MPFDNRNINDEMSESFLNEFKERMAVDPLSDSVRHVKTTASRRQGIVIAVLIVLAVCAGICWNLYSSYINDNSKATEIPVLKANHDPIKVRPAEPGGMNIRDMDKTVYGRIAEDEAAGEGYENVLPDAEKPAVPPRVAAPAPAPAPTPAPATAQAASAAAAPSAPAPAPAAAPSAPVAKAAPTPAPKAYVPPSTSVSSASSTGDFRVQLVSLKSRDAALKAWADALKKNKALLADYDYEIIEAAIPGKGTYYRLRVKSFATRDDASKLCSALKAGGQDCIIATK